MKKTILSLSVLLIFIGIAACGSDTENGTGSDGNNEATASDTTVTTEQIEELDELESTNDSLKELEQDLDAFIESLN